MTAVRGPVLAPGPGVKTPRGRTGDDGPTTPRGAYPPSRKRIPVSKILKLQKLETGEAFGPMAISWSSCDSSSCNSKQN